MEGFRCRLCPPPLSWLGTSPSPTFLLRPSAGAGTPRYEDWVHGLMEGFRCRPCTPPFPWLGTRAPALHFSFDPRLVPAHQGTKIGCVGRWKGSGVACAPHRPPGWGLRAPALHFSFDPRLTPRRPGDSSPGSAAAICRARCVSLTASGRHPSHVRARLRDRRSTRRSDAGPWWYWRHRRARSSR